jgi:dipeptidyl aminopeptidase/acylaminoacyl peptidase
MIRGTAERGRSAENGIPEGRLTAAPSRAATGQRAATTPSPHLVLEPLLSHVGSDGVVVSVALRVPAGSPLSCATPRRTTSRYPPGWVISIHGGPNMQEQPTYRYDGLYQYPASRGVGVLAPTSAALPATEPATRT